MNQFHCLKVVFVPMMSRHQTGAEKIRLVLWVQESSLQALSFQLEILLSLFSSALLFSSLVSA